MLNLMHGSAGFWQVSMQVGSGGPQLTKRSLGWHKFGQSDARIQIPLSLTKPGIHRQAPFMLHANGHGLLSTPSTQVGSQTVPQLS